MILKILQPTACCAMLLCGVLQASAQADITDNGGILTAQYNNTNANENYPKVIDNSVSTKYFTGGQTALWIRYQSAYPAIVNQYTLTSGNDHADRDPKNWTLEGSNDGSSWTVLNTQTNQLFTARLQTRTFPFSNSVSYLYYRLNITGNNGSVDTQLAEWELWATGVATAPDDLSATALSGQRVSLSWTDNAANETGFVIERSMDGVAFQTGAITAPNVQQYTDSNLSASAPYIYRVRAQNAAGTSAATASASVITTGAPALTDITDFTEGVISDQHNTTGGEGIAKLIDNDLYSKYLAWASTTWMRFYLPAGAVVSQYAIVSGNDAPDRDPRNWTFEGSTDGTSWTTLNTQTGHKFTARRQRRLFSFPNTNSYTYYRLRVTANSGSSITQLTELELFGTGSGTLNTAAPAAPSGFTAQAVSGNQIVLNWTDNAVNETLYRLERSTDSLNWNYSREIKPQNTRFHSLELSPFTTYYYRLRAENTYGNSAYVHAKATTPTNAPPATWQEHWFQHNKLLDRVYQDGEISVYYDEAVSPSITWMQEDFSGVWSYVKENYGTFSDPTLYLIFHGATYSGGHPATVFGADHDYRNVSDVGGVWTDRSGWNLGATTHEIGHVVEFAAHGVDGSPAFGIWGDSKWAEIFVYDVYKRMGWTADEQSAYTDFMNNVDDFPRAGTQWFKNWFYPIYSQSDSSACLNRYFVLLAEYFPQRNGKYERALNMGEFVHFWSGAANFNVQRHADTAFGWTDQMEMQFRQAQIDFPFTYPEPSLFSPMQMKAPVLTAPAEPSIRPNPASGTVYFTSPDPAQTYNVDIYSMSGAKVAASRVSGTNVPVSVAGLPDGVYVVAVSDVKGKIVRREKIVVSNSGR